MTPVEQIAAALNKTADKAATRSHLRAFTGLTYAQIAEAAADPQFCPVTRGSKNMIAFVADVREATAKPRGKTWGDQAHHVVESGFHRSG